MVLRNVRESRSKKMSKPLYSSHALASRPRCSPGPAVPIRTQPCTAQPCKNVAGSMGASGERRHGAEHIPTRALRGSRRTCVTPREYRQPPEVYPMNRCVLSTARSCSLPCLQEHQYTPSQSPPTSSRCTGAGKYGIIRQAVDKSHLVLRLRDRSVHKHHGGHRQPAEHESGAWHRSPKLGTTSGSKHQSGPNRPGHEAEHFPRRV